MLTRDEYVAVTKSAFQTLGKKAITQFFLTKLPFLASPFLSPFVGYFAGMAAEAVVTNGETAAFFLFIDMRVGAQGKAFEEAAYANFKAQQTGTKQEKLRAAENLKKEFAAFASLRS